MNNHSKDILNCRVSGNGHPVVFLHGYLESITMWDKLDRGSYQSIDVDLHGHGQSKNISVPNTLEEMALDVEDLLKSLGIGEYSLVGHSMGGYVGLELLANDQFCQQLMLLNSNFWEDTPKKVIDRERIAKIVETNASLFLYEAIPNLFLNPDKYDREVRALIAEAMQMIPNEIGNASLAMSRRKNHLETIRSNARNICVVQGDQDSIVSHEKMKNVLSDIEIEYHELSGVGHMAHIESREVIETLLKKFII